MAIRAQPGVAHPKIKTSLFGFWVSAVVSCLIADLTIAFARPTHKHQSRRQELTNRIDWNDPRSSTDLNLLDQFLAVDNAQPPTSVYVTLSPPISATATLTQNPVTELCTLPYASTLSVLEAKQLNADLISFRTALMEQMPQVASPRSWAMGQLDRPCKLDHAHSPSGKATVHFLAVGWDSVDAHLSAKETAKFSEGVAPLMEKMLAPIPGLEMKHVSFQKV